MTEMNSIRKISIFHRRTKVIDKRIRMRRNYFICMSIRRTHEKCVRCLSVWARSIRTLVFVLLVLFFFVFVISVSFHLFIGWCVYVTSIRFVWLPCFHSSHGKGITIWLLLLLLLLIRIHNYIRCILRFIWIMWTNEKWSRHRITVKWITCAASCGGCVYVRKSQFTVAMQSSISIQSVFLSSRQIDKHISIGRSVAQNALFVSHDFVRGLFHSDIIYSLSLIIISDNYYSLCTKRNN